jgi:hypothetical protein
MSRGGWQRDASHLATVGALQGRGTSQQAALGDLSSQLAAMASRASEAPCLWWDAANQSLWIAVPDAVSAGSTSYRVGFETGTPVLSRCTSSNAAPASEAHASAVGMVPVTTGP